jgi:hypothetical protein
MGLGEWRGEEAGLLVALLLVLLLLEGCGGRGDMRGGGENGPRVVDGVFRAVSVDERGEFEFESGLGPLSSFSWT